REAWTAFREGASVGDVFKIIEKAFSPGFFEKAIATFRSLVTQGFNYILANLPGLISGFLAFKQQILNAVIQIALGIANQLPTIIPALIQGLITVATTLVNGLVATVPRFVAAAGELINGLADGIVRA